MNKQEGWLLQMIYCYLHEWMFNNCIMSIRHVCTENWQPGGKETIESCGLAATSRGERWEENGSWMLQRACFLSWGVQVLHGGKVGTSDPLCSQFLSSLFAESNQIHVEKKCNSSSYSTLNLLSCCIKCILCWSLTGSMIPPPLV